MALPSLLRRACLPLIASLFFLFPAVALADDFDWRQLFFDGFEAGSADWELQSNWQIAADDTGAHSLRGNGAGTATLMFGAPWKNHRLMFRFQLVSGALQLGLRQGEDEGYRVRIGEQGLTLLRQRSPGADVELADASTDVALSGWHMLVATLFGDHLIVALDNSELINVVDLAPVGQGSLEFALEEGSQAFVDDVWIMGKLPLPDTPPDVSRVSIGPVGIDGMVAVQGAPSSVPAGATVYAVNPETLDLATTTAGGDGAWEVTLFAPEGSAIQVNYGYPGAMPFFGNIGLEGSPAIVLTVPNGPEAGDGLPYAIGDRVSSGYWVARGVLPRSSLAQGEALTTTLTLRIESSCIPSLDLDNTRIQVDVALQRLFDDEGNQLPAVRDLASAFLTPSGLAVEAEKEVADPWLLTVTAGDLILGSQGRVLTATIPISLLIPSELPSGTYRPLLRVTFQALDDSGWAPIPNLEWDDDYIMLERQDPSREYPWPLLPPVRIGSPKAPRLTWSLFSDYASNSERGVRTLEDTHYSLAPRTTYPTNKIVLPRRDAAAGEPVAYTLEPSLPLTSWGFRNLYERVLLSPPSIPLAYPGGQVSIAVTGPDGHTTDLGTSGFLSGMNPLASYRPDEADPSRVHRTLVNAFDNPGPSDYYRGFTGDSAFSYVFPRDGRYVIQVEGQMTDVWGNVYEAGGTYEVWIGNALDIELGSPEGVPLEVGDSLSPVVRVQPAVPADVELEYTLYINSSVTNTVSQAVKGKADRFGYFAPAPTSALTASAPGEYDLRVTATYWDGDGNLWMGSVRGASVVETPGTPLEAHGERGIRSFAAVKRPIWFAEGRSGNVVPGQMDGLFDDKLLGGSLHLPYPFATGDVMWLVDWEGQNSVFPTITFNDTWGAIADLLEARVPELRQGAYYYGQFPNQLLPIDRRAIGELPLLTTTSLAKREGATYGLPAGQFPEEADQIAYFYAACLKPDVEVAMQVSESGLGDAYWFADDNYNLQYGQGRNGDIAPDYKVNYGGLVFRDLEHGVTQYAIYASSDIYISPGDPASNRIMPPFRGNAGGPDGGPLMTLLGQEVNLFVQPTGVKPGTVLEVGDTFAFSAQIVPTLASNLVVTVTLPSGEVRTIAGRANKIGYFYDPAQDFVVSEAGAYRVQVKAWHDGMTSAGLTQPPYPEGSVLGSPDGCFEVYVVEQGAWPLQLDIPQDSKVVPAQPLDIAGSVPFTWASPQVSYTLTFAGFILDQGTLPVVDGGFSYRYDPIALHGSFPNLDISIIPQYLTYIPWNEPEAADTVQFTFFGSGMDGGRRVEQARSVTLQGMRLLAPDPIRRHQLPLLVKGMGR